MLLYRKLTDAKAAVAESGLMRLPAKKLTGETRSEGSNPSRRVVVSTFGGNHIIFIPTFLLLICAQSVRLWVGYKLQVIWLDEEPLLKSGGRNCLGGSSPSACVSEKSQLRYKRSIYYDKYARRIC